MSRNNCKTIKELVFNTIHRNIGHIIYSVLEESVLKQFSSSAFNKTHWAWYRYQCGQGKYSNQFSSEEKRNLMASVRAKKTRAQLKKKKPNRSSEIQAMPINKGILLAIRRIIKEAVAYENATGGTRKLGITGEVGEVLACYHLKLKLCIDPRTKGYDAIDRFGKLVQIKTRRSEAPGLPNDAGRIGTFSKHLFDYVILVILNRDYSLAQLWRAKFRDILPLIEKHKRRNPNLSYFKKNAECIWPMAD